MGRLRGLWLWVLVVLVVACGGDGDHIRRAAFGIGGVGPAWSGGTLTLVRATPTRLTIAWPVPVAGTGAALEVVEVGKRRVRLRFDGATDDYDEFSHYFGFATPPPFDVVSGSSLGDQIYTTRYPLDPGTSYTLGVFAQDDEGHTSSTLTTAVTTLAASTPAVWPTGTTAATSFTFPSTGRVFWSTTPIDAVAYTVRRSVDGGPFVDWWDSHEYGGDLSNLMAAAGDDFALGSTYDFQVFFRDDTGAVTATPLTAHLGIPAPPIPTAPPLEPSRITPLVERSSWLYTGSDPVQRDMTPGVIVPARVGVLHGRVRSRDDNSLLGGARVSVHGHPEYGYTFSRIDGRWDLVINGGGVFRVDFERPGMLPVQRSVNVPWDRDRWVDEVALTVADDAVTEIDPDGGAGTVGWTRAEGATHTDADGTRHATVFVPEGTQLTAHMGEESGAIDEPAHLRITEYTVGPRGPRAMPGPVVAPVSRTSPSRSVSNFAQPIRSAKG